MAPLWRFLWVSFSVGLLLFTALYVPIKLRDPDGFERVERIREELETLHSRNRQLRSRNDSLRQQIRAIQSDADYVENIARNDFGLILENEVVYQF